MRLVPTILTCIAGCAVCHYVARGSDNPIATQRGVVHIQLEDEAITPATVRFMQRALQKAQRVEAVCLVIELDTPGGVLKSTQQIVTDILASEVPVVVYVSPSSGRAASAGLFITLASHVAAMAPGTRIGAAHPVQVGGLPFAPPQTPASPQPKKPSDSPAQADETPDRLSAMEAKLVNDTVAWARSLAELRNRNAEWAAIAVSESRVLVASEAVQEQVVDVMAANVTDLLQKIDGREVLLQTGPTGSTALKLHTKEARLHTLEMWWGERLLAVISNPNIAVLLMIFGVYGIMFELSSPGWGVAGTLGVISLVLGFFGLSVLPFNYAGLALIAIALGLFAAEAFVTSFGALTVGGIVCLILGGTMLIDSPTGFLHISLEVLVPISVATGLITVFLVGSVVKAQRGRVQTGEEGLLGLHAIAQDSFAADESEFQGTVFVHGELWKARSSEPVAAGASVKVNGREGLILQVEQNSQQTPPSKLIQSDQAHTQEKGARL